MSMSKGKRKSVPGVYQIIQHKLRAGTLSPEDRNTLHQLARLDLIDLIENELGIQLKGSQKNSVAAMVDFLLGPEGGEASGRRRPRRRAPLQMKRPRPGASEQRAAGTSSAATGAPHHRPQLAGNLETQSRHGYFASGSAGISPESASEGGVTNNVFAAAQEEYDTAEASCQGPDTSGDSRQETQQLQQQPRHVEQGHWLRELQMHLKAAQTTDDIADEPGVLADDASTPQSTLLMPGWSEQHAVAAAAGHAAQHQQYCQQPYSNNALSDEALETRLLDQLLRDMQLSPQPQLQQQLPQPALLQQQQDQHQLLPAYSPHGQMLQVFPVQQQEAISHQNLQDAAQPQHQQQQSLLQAQYSLPLQQQELHLPNMLFPESQPQRPAGQALVEAPLQQQQDAYMLQHRQQHQDPSPHHQQQQVQQQQYMIPYNPNPGGDGSAAAAAVEGSMSAGLYQSFQLPGDPPAAAPESWTGPLHAPAYEAYTHIDSSLLGSQHCQGQQQQHDLSGDTGAVGMIKKRDRRQLSWQAAAVAAARDAAAAPLTVELSGPSADVSIKRMSFVTPGTGSVSALTTSTAGAAAAELQRQLSSAHSQQNIGSSDDQQQHSRGMLQHPHNQHQQQLQPRSSLKKGMKGLARRFKAFLRPGSSAQQQTRLVGASGGSHAAATTAGADSSMELLSELHDAEESCVQAPISHQYSTASLSDFRLPTGTSNFGSFAASRAASAPGAYLPQQSLSSSQGGDQQEADRDHFAEKLQLLRAMYEGQYRSQQTTAMAEAAAVGDLAPADVQSMPHLLGLPALKEEMEMSGSPPTAAPGVDAECGAEVGTSSPIPFMQKLTKAFGLGSRPSNSEAAAAVLTAAAGGLSVTERSNSSFSLFLARVASSWRQESSSTAATTLPVSSEYWPSQTTVTGSMRQSSHSSYNRPFMPDIAMIQGWSSMRIEGSTAAGAAAATAAAAAGAGAACVEQSRGSFSKMFGPCAGSHPAAAGAAAAGVEHSHGSFSRLFGACAGGDNTAAAALAVAAAGHGLAVEGSRGSFSQRLLGMCAGGNPDNTTAAAPAAGVMAQGAEDSKGSFSALFDRTAGDQHGHPAAAAAQGLVREGRQCSFIRLFGGADGASGVAGAEGRQGSFNRVFAGVGKQTAAMEGRQAPVTRALGTWSTGGSSASGGSGDSGVAPAGTQQLAVEGSRGSFSRLLFGPCAGVDPAAAASASLGVEGSGRSLTQRLFAPCAGPMDNSSNTSARESSAAAALSAGHPATHAGATHKQVQLHQAVSMECQPRVGSGLVHQHGQRQQEEQQEEQERQSPPPGLNVAWQQYDRQQHLQQQHAGFPAAAPIVAAVAGDMAEPSPPVSDCGQVSFPNAIVAPAAAHHGTQCSSGLGSVLRTSASPGGLLGGVGSGELLQLPTADDPGLIQLDQDQHRTGAHL